VVVVVDDQLVVSGQAHVEFDSVCTLLDRESERSRGVLRSVDGGPAMAIDKRSAVARSGRCPLAHARAIYRAPRAPDVD
jgi:arginine/ornithine N-succinyltransferase beta subunit